MVTSGIKMVEEKLTGKVTVKEVINQDVKNGVVAVYKVENDCFNLPLIDFYLATFGDIVSAEGEEAFGVGATPEDALESASREWEKRMWNEEDNYNPFREVLEKLKLTRG